MWHDAIYDLTPVEKIGDIWFKREDKFSPDGMHNGSKFRQLIWLFSRATVPRSASAVLLRAARSFRWSRLAPNITA